MDKRAKALLVYDGDCGFCRLWIERWRRATGGRVDYEPYQDAAARFSEIPLESFQRSVKFLGRDGEWSEGARAVFKALAEAPGHGWPLRLYEGIPLLAWASERAYRFVASQRGFFSFLTRLLVSPRR